MKEDCKKIMEHTEKGKTVSQSLVETVHLVHPSDMNAVGRLYGGTLMSWIDDVAVLVAKRHSEMNVTTASVDNLRFLRSAGIEDTVVLIGRATHVGNTSMEIKVETYVEHMSSERELVNRAFLTLVGLDENNKPARLPRLILETEEDRLEWERAQQRRDIRKKQKDDGFHFYS